MNAQNDTTSEVARVLAEHGHYAPDASERGDLADANWECADCGHALGVPFDDDPTSAMAAHQTAMLAEAGLLRPQIAASVPAGQPAAGSAGRGASGGLDGPQIVVEFTADTSKFTIGMLQHQVALLKRQVALLKRQVKRSTDAEAVIERVEALAESEHAHGDAITRCNLVAQRIRDAIDGPKVEKNENEEQR